MRKRTLSPGFFRNEVLAELPPLARILYEGLWCLADRQGRLEDRPRRIKADLLAYDDVDANDLLVALEEKNFITRYSIDGKRYISIIRFLHHQHPHPSEQPSEIPPPPKPENKKDLHVEHLGDPHGAPSNDARSTFQMRSRVDPGSSDPDPDPDPLHSEVERPGVGQIPLGDASPPARARFDFEREVYGPYPRHRGKTKGLEACRKQIKTAADFEGLKRAARNFAFEMRREGRAMDKIPYFSTWMHSEQWRDSVNVQPPPLYVAREGPIPCPEPPKDAWEQPEGFRTRDDANSDEKNTA